MAADTTGSKSLDSIRTNQLCAEVILLSKNILKPKGVLVSKLFMGEDFIEVKNLAKSIFENVNLTFSFEGDLDAKKVERAVELSVEKYCSVAKILEQTANITWDYEINGETFKKA